MKSAGKARNNGLYRHIRTSKEIIRNLLNDYFNNFGKTGSAVTNLLADITGDGKINLLDLGVFKNNFGKTTSACTVAY